MQNKGSSATFTEWARGSGYKVSRQEIWQVLSHKLLNFGSEQDGMRRARVTSTQHQFTTGQVLFGDSITTLLNMHNWPGAVQVYLLPILQCLLLLLLGLQPPCHCCLLLEHVLLPQPLAGKLMSRFGSCNIGSSSSSSSLAWLEASLLLTYPPQVDLLDV